MSNTRNLVRFHDDHSQPRFYSPLPVDIARHPTMESYTVRVAAFIWSHQEGFQQSASAIADAIGLHRDTVSKALDELQAFGWLVREVYTKPGNKKPSWERWHIQRRNVPWTTAQVERLAKGEPAGSVGSMVEAAGSVGNPCLQEQQVPAGSVGNIGIQEKYIQRNTPSAAQGQLRNATGDSVEPEPLGESQSLAAKEESRTEEDSPFDGKQPFKAADKDDPFDEKQPAIPVADIEGAFARMESDDDFLDAFPSEEEVEVPSSITDLEERVGMSLPNDPRFDEPVLVAYEAPDEEIVKDPYHPDYAAAKSRLFEAVAP